MWQGSKFPLDQWSVTAITVSGPVELSFVLVHWTSNFYDNCQAISLYFSSHTTEREKCLYFCGPYPLVLQWAKDYSYEKKSVFYNAFHCLMLNCEMWSVPHVELWNVVSPTCWTVKHGQSHMYAIYEWQGINNVARNWCRQWPGSYQSWYVLLTGFTPSHLSGIGV